MSSDSSIRGAEIGRSPTASTAAAAGATTVLKGSLLHRYLDPATSLAEILFGLIMTLTFTLGAGLIIQDEGREGAREMLIAVLGCNIAWGIIDAALYLVGELFDRGRLRRLGLAIRHAPDTSAAAALVASELDPLLGDVLDRPASEALYRRIADNVIAQPPRSTRITREDWLGAFTSFWLVVIASFPAAIPFLLIDDPLRALRVSNAILLALMFLCGYLWARYTLSRPWLVGLVFLFIGLGLVLAAIALGG
jgi:VIT family